MSAASRFAPTSGRYSQRLRCPAINGSPGAGACEAKAADAPARLPCSRWAGTVKGSVARQQTQTEPRKPVQDAEGRPWQNTPETEGVLTEFRWFEKTGTYFSCPSPKSRSKSQTRFCSFSILIGRVRVPFTRFLSVPVKQRFMEAAKFPLRACARRVAGRRVGQKGVFFGPSVPSRR